MTHKHPSNGNFRPTRHQGAFNGTQTTMGNAKRSAEERITLADKASAELARQLQADSDDIKAALAIVLKYGDDLSLVDQLLLQCEDFWTNQEIREHLKRLPPNMLDRSATYETVVFPRGAAKKHSTSG